jgi:AraC-like DNA-binding protein
MMTDGLTRSVRAMVHDDGVNAWDAARIAPPAEIARDIYGYGDYWERTGSFTVRRELPHAEGVLIVNLGAPIAITGGNGERLEFAAGEAFVAGPHLRPALSHSGGEQSGIHVLLPLVTLRRMLGVSMDQLADQVVPLDALLGRRARELCERLGEAGGRMARVAALDDALTGWLRSSSAVGRQTESALRLLRSRPDLDIAEIAREIGWSRKHLADRIQNAVGVGPRSFRRLLRFQQLVELLGEAEKPVDWAALACEAGYFDQSHMIREFREFSGLTPGAYLARTLPDGGGLVEA